MSSEASLCVIPVAVLLHSQGMWGGGIIFGEKKNVLRRWIVEKEIFCYFTLLGFWVNFEKWGEKNWTEKRLRQGNAVDNFVSLPQTKRVGQ